MHFNSPWGASEISQSAIEPLGLDLDSFYKFFLVKRTKCKDSFNHFTFDKITPGQAGLHCQGIS